jgi:hypothetical protein
MGFLPAKPVQSAIRQDALEEHGQFFHGFVTVVFRQLHHAVLHYVQCRLVVADVINRSLESAFFHALQKVRQFAISCQVWIAAKNIEGDCQLFWGSTLLWSRQDYRTGFVNIRNSRFKNARTVR